MHYIRNWPEGLFILLVLFAPMGAAFWLSSSFGRFIAVLLVGIVCGLAVWLGTVFMASRFTLGGSAKKPDHEAVPARPATRGQQPMYTFGPDTTISSVPVPEGFEAKGEALGSTVWLTRKGQPDAAMVVCLFALQHDTVKAAQDGREGFVDFAAGGRMWRVAIPDPDEETGSEDSFMAILVLKDSAVAAYGARLGWTEDELRGFLTGVRLAAH